MAETSTTWYDFTNLFHAFAAAPVTHGTVVDVAGGIVVVVVAVDDDCEHPDTTKIVARAMGRKRFIAWTKLGDSTPEPWECSKRLSQ